MRRRQRGQSVIEFGIIAILFTLIMFAIADFGILLNDWLSVSTHARHLARDAAVGVFSCDPNSPPCLQPDMWTEATALALNIPGVGTDQHYTTLCCSVNSAVVLSVAYFDNCTPGVAGCSPMTGGALLQLDDRYGTGPFHGQCTTHGSCPHPAPPKGPPNCRIAPSPCPGDSVQVTFVAAGAQVITPLVRQVFEINAAPNQCPDNSSPSHCYVPLASTVTMRFEGDVL